MSAFRMLSLTLLFAALGAAPALTQQSSGAATGRTLSSHAVAAAPSEHDATADEQRAELTDLISRADVREVADDRGIEMGRVEPATAGLSDGQVTAISPLVDAVPRNGDGGGLGTSTDGTGVRRGGVAWSHADWVTASSRGSVHGRCDRRAPGASAWRHSPTAYGSSGRLRAPPSWTGGGVRSIPAPA